MTISLLLSLLKFGSNYPSLCKGIQPRVGEQVTGTYKIKYYQDIDKRLFLKYEVYGPYVQNKKKGKQA